MPQAAPHAVVIAGPNGAGKSTSAPELLRGALGVREFVDADVVARGISAFQPEGVALEAGRIMLRRLRELAAARVSFAFETTLAARGFAPWFQELRHQRYRVHLLFLWLPDADAAIRRVAERVRLGGHGVPEETIRRRYERGLRNFFTIYMAVVDSWRFYDNSARFEPRLVAVGGRMTSTRVNQPDLWDRLAAKHSDAG